MADINLSELPFDYKVYQHWYETQQVPYEIVKQLAGRETVFFGLNIKVRCIKAHYVGILKSNFERFELNKILNIYHSVARLNGMPIFSYNPAERKPQQDEFTKKFANYLTHYDFFLDIDGKRGFDKVYESAARCKELFDKFQVRYSLRSSGSGFHIFVLQEDAGIGKFQASREEYDKYCYETSQSVSDEGISEIPMGKVMYDRLRAYESVAKSLKLIEGVLDIDDTIYQIRRVCKCPYTIDYKTGNLCLPLDDAQFKALESDSNIIKPEFVLKNPKYLYNRGTLIRNGLPEGKGFENLMGYVIDGN